MRFLLDTHALLWWITGDPALPGSAKKYIASHEHSVVVSAASAWEIATKYRIGKLPHCAELAMRFDSILGEESFEPLPISSAHASRAGLLPGPHRDPFDRILIAQTQAENLPVLSSDKIFDAYQVHRLW